MTSLGWMPVVLAVAQTPPSPPVAPPTFSSGVELVIVDAVVVDKQGRPVEGLRRQDFQVLEDGVPQKIDSFDSVVLPPQPAEKPAPAPAVSSNQMRDKRSGRTFVILFDDLHMTALQAGRGKAAVAQFLTTGVREGDLVMLLPTSGGAWWSSRMEAGRDELMQILRRYEGRRIQENASQDRMTDWEAMRILNFQDQETARKVAERFQMAGLTSKLQNAAGDQPLSPINVYVLDRARQTYAQAVARNRVTLRTMDRALRSLGTAKGRKSLIIVSQGFIWDPSLQEVKNVVTAARESNVTIYFVDTRGLKGNFSPFCSEFIPDLSAQDLPPVYSVPLSDADGTEKIVDETGGFTVRGTKGLAVGLNRIALESQAYYLLGYAPTNTAQDGSFHSIDVKVDRKDVTVRARRGYYAGGASGSVPTDEEHADPVMQQALDTPFDMDDVPLRLTTYVFDETLIGRARVLVAADVGIENAAFRSEEGRLVDTLDIYLAVAQRETGEVWDVPQKIAMRLRPRTLEKNPYYPLIREFDLPTGQYQAKLVARDVNGGLVGTVVHPFEVPDLGGLRVSTPVISDAVKDDPKSGQLRPVVLARRVLRPTDKIYYQIEVYNAQKDVASGKPEVMQGFRLVRDDGVVVREGAPSLILPGEGNRVTRLAGIPVEHVLPGHYRLDLSVKDELSGQSANLSESIEIEPVPPGS